MPVAGVQLPGSWHSSLAAQVTGFCPAHVPAWQMSVSVQALPSLHAAVLLVWTQPVVALHESSVHPFASPQFVAEPPTHVAEEHVVAWVQALWSSHWVPFGLTVPWQTPALEAVHLSLAVQSFPSSHATPVLAVYAHAPVLALQVPAFWHWLGAAQITGLEPTQTPRWQLSVAVHLLPSEQVVPFTTEVLVHLFFTQVSAVHVFPSSHCDAFVHDAAAAEALCSPISLGGMSLIWPDPLQAVSRSDSASATAPVRFGRTSRPDAGRAEVPSPLEQKYVT
jgi:hypothetical protein